jgi:hypothetical protein
MNGRPQKRTYYISPLRLYLAPGILAGLAILIFTLAGFGLLNPDERKPSVIIGFVFLALAALIYLLVRRTRVQLSADGIKLYQTGYRLETDWDNIASFHDEPGAEGLVLHRPMDCPGARTLAAFRNVSTPGGDFSEGANFYSDDQIQLIAEHRFIPIAAFAYWLKKGALRDDLIQRAPALRNADPRGA